MAQITQEEKIDIRGLDKVDLLYQLWKNAPVARFFTVAQLSAPLFDKEEAETAVLSYVDYFCGRCIKSDISGDSVSSEDYDSNTGAGNFKKIVEDMRSGKAGKNCDKKENVPMGYKCPNGSGKEYRPVAYSAIPGNPGPFLCRSCPYPLNRHIPYY
jgi:hypothetical protein